MAKRKRCNSAEATANTINFNDYVNRRKQVTLIPKSLHQEEYIELLQDVTKHIVFATGPAGTGKTMLAVTAAIGAFKQGEVSKIILTRPAVGVDDEKHGFLPGGINEKMEPWTRPLFDVFYEYYSPKEVANMLDDQIIEISPLAYMRGRNFKNAWIIADEMQNATPNQVKMLLTRISEGSKVVVTGDLNQMDKQFYNDNGLRDFLSRLKQSPSPMIAFTEFTRKDVQRHPVVSAVLELYDEE